jgi:hypothetical protein
MKNVILQDGRYYKEFDVVLVASKEIGKAGDLVYNERNKDLFIARIDCGQIYKHNLFFLSDEKIQEGDWYLDDLLDFRRAVTSDEDYWSARPKYKKIVATTIDLIYPIANKNQQPKFLPKPNAEFIDFYIGRKLHLNDSYETLIELRKDFYGHFDEGGEDWRYNVKICLDGTMNTKAVDSISIEYWNELFDIFYIENDAHIQKWSSENRLLLEFKKWTKKQTKFKIIKK